MPEGPECRRYALSLGDHIGGENLIEVEVVSGRYLSKNKIHGLDLLKNQLPQKVVGVGVGDFVGYEVGGFNTFGSIQSNPNNPHNNFALILPQNWKPLLNY